MTGSGISAMPALLNRARVTGDSAYRGTTGRGFVRNCVIRVKIRKVSLAPVSCHASEGLLNQPGRLQLRREEGAHQFRVQALATAAFDDAVQQFALALGVRDGLAGIPFPRRPSR